MSTHVLVAGIGMTPFCKPAQSPSYLDLGQAAVRDALHDAGLAYDAIEQAYAGYVYGDSTAGQRVLYQVGMSGIPVFNVNNNCATGSTALYLARQAITSGAAECVLALGFEQMRPGAIAAQFPDRPTPFDKFDALTTELVGMPELPLALRYFGGAGLAHMREFGTRLQTFAKIRAKASRHAEHNERAVLRTVLTAEDVMASPSVWDGVMTRLMACPPTCGAAAAILCSPAFAARHGLSKASVRIAGQAMATDRPQTFESKDMRQLVGADMTRQAATKAYEYAGYGPEDVDVVELHDCFAHNELISYEGLGLCRPGMAERLVENGDNTYGGKYVINPSGGLLAKGHPLGATGLAQCFELVSQLRGACGPRQVDSVRVALQHNLGLGGACVVTLYARH
ncbi:lipid-transfer protein [Achromobacter marplatensis]|uniref:propanoyl-CoA C-acyltransferase n=1 Tax=Achromobacter marplatensis TaxID=470868 RepID=A0AA42WAW0_9BURK|nr:lipid-transfer protein [Achromobacter marplatensis]MDH2050259.1 lipid-transfer protein [Achromobacter marplatensis]